MTGVIQTWDPTYGLSTQKQPIFFINVPKTVRKGSCVYGLNRPYASRHCERPRGLVGTILVSTDIYKTLFTRWCVYFKLDMDLKFEISPGRFSRSGSRFREIKPLKQRVSTANI